MANRIVIAGGSGFIGVSLAMHLTARGDEVTVLSRRVPRADTPWRTVEWDGRTIGAWASTLEGAAAIVNLAGRSVDCVKTPDHRDEILRSRVQATRVLGEACRTVNAPPPVWVQMSTAHIYGDPPTVRCDESSATGLGLAPEVGRAWEEAFAAAVVPGQRGVVLRTSFVVGRPNAGGTGALGRLGWLARAGLGGRVGNGRQGFSWIHEADMNGIFDRAIRSPEMQGVYVASSPHPVSQREFAKVLRRHAGGLGRLGIGLPAFGWMVRFAAPRLLRTDPELALYGRYVLPTRLQREGFAFSYPTLEPALAEIYARQNRSERRHDTHG